MSDRFQIQYDTVYIKTAELRSRIEAELADMESTYRQVEHELHDMDGKTNACLQETVEANRQKAYEAASTLDELLQFLNDSARQVEINEHKMARAMTDNIQ
ncbi:MAG: hypothetical protein FWE34_06745 [Defluviitaleaceae bacterium]|nr:hypothetical protein [Defluviitaleaceae bacterium]